MTIAILQIIWLKKANSLIVCPVQCQMSLNQNDCFKHRESARKHEGRHLRLHLEASIFDIILIFISLQNWLTIFGPFAKKAKRAAHM